MFPFSIPQSLNQIHQLKLVDKIMVGLKTPLAEKDNTVSLVIWCFCISVSHRLFSNGVFPTWIIFPYFSARTCEVQGTSLKYPSIFKSFWFNFFPSTFLSFPARYATLDSVLFLSIRYLWMYECMHLYKWFLFVTNNTKPNQTVWKTFHSHLKQAL